jgi:hypothetical protein
MVLQNAPTARDAGGAVLGLSVGTLANLALDVACQI